MPKLFRPSGGLKYHTRAALSRALWRPTQNDVASWLQRWDPPVERELLILGASGGYILKREWLARFRKIHAYDLDPLAPAFFALNHRFVKFTNRDLFFVAGKLSLAPLAALFAEKPDATILFSNILGQIPLEGKVEEKEWLDFLSALRFMLQRRCWASVHDLWTFEPLPNFAHAACFKSFVETGDPQRIFSGATAPIEAVDHLMSGSWANGLERQLFSWSLTRQSLHILAGVHS